MVVLFSILLFVSIGFGVVLIMCELAQRACDHFNDIDEIMLQWNWYLFPNEIQRILPLVLIVVQTPVQLECFRSISCTRETFQKASTWPIKYIIIWLTLIITKLFSLGYQQGIFVFHDSPKFQLMNNEQIFFEYTYSLYCTCTFILEI